MMEGIAEVKSVNKSKFTAMLLAILFGPWTWVYTYSRDYLKFWVSIGLIFVVYTVVIFTYEGQRELSALSLYILLPILIFLVLHDVFSAGISLVVIFVGAVTSFGNESRFFYIYVVWALIWVWAIIDTIAKPNPRYMIEFDERNRILAVILAVLFSYNTWLYTYSRNAKKFWVSFGITIVIVPLFFGIIQLLSQGQGAPYLFIGLLITIGPFILLLIWLWAIIDTLRRQRESIDRNR